MGRRAKPQAEFDRELRELPEPLRRPEHIMRIEAVIFASPQPVPRQKLASVIGDACNLDLLIADIREELRSRPYDIVTVGGGYQHRTRPGYAPVIHGSGTLSTARVNLSPLEQLALTVIAYFQPVTRIEIGDIMGKPISRDVIGVLRTAGLSERVLGVPILAHLIHTSPRSTFWCITGLTVSRSYWNLIGWKRPACSARRRHLGLGCAAGVAA
jgi:chromosome segregation and condensation protein ScpB